MAFAVIQGFSVCLLNTPYYPTFWYPLLVAIEDCLIGLVLLREVYLFRTCIFTKIAASTFALLGVWYVVQILTQIRYEWFSVVASWIFMASAVAAIVGYILRRYVR